MRIALDPASADTVPLQVEYRELTGIRPAARNPRTHAPAQIAKIKASLASFGWTNPMLIADGMLIAGHGRLQSALELASEGVAIPRNPAPGLGPTIDLSPLSPEQRRAYLLADNRLAEDAGWADDLLALELAELAQAGFDLALTGFDDDETGRLLALLVEPPAGDPEEVPEPPVNPVTRPGDVWILGRHRLVCGDCTDADAVARALNGVVPLLMVTDPPYGVDYKPDWRVGLDPVKRATGKVVNDGRADWREAWALFPGDVAYVWHADKGARTVQDDLEACGFQIRSQIIWRKPHFVLSRGDYHAQHEPCWYAVRKGATGHWAGDRTQSTVWDIANGTFQGGKAKAEDARTGHGTQKPVECMQRPIENNTSPGQAVYDPFVGSGTTIVAAELTGRCCHAIELNPAYCDVTILRWQNLIGSAATLENDGRTFEEMADARYDPGQDGRESYDHAIAALRERRPGDTEQVTAARAATAGYLDRGAEDG